MTLQGTFSPSRTVRFKNPAKAIDTVTLLKGVRAQLNCDGFVEPNLFMEGP